MRIIAPLILAILGGGIGFAVNKLFSRSWLSAQVAIALGIASAFLGLVVRDALDYSFTSDPLIDALLAAILAATGINLIAHTATSFKK